MTWQLFRSSERYRDLSQSDGYRWRDIKHDGKIKSILNKTSSRMVSLHSTLVAEPFMCWIIYMKHLSPKLCHDKSFDQISIETNPVASC